VTKSEKKEWPDRTGQDKIWNAMQWNEDMTTNWTTEGKSESSLMTSKLLFVLILDWNDHYYYYYYHYYEYEYEYE
jgi:hypothetical protein